MTYEQLLNAIRALIQYNWVDERNDYAENPGDTHIFNVIVDLDNFITGKTNKPEDYIG